MSLEEECSICLELLNKGDIAILDCNHIFHVKCINSWSLSYDIKSNKKVFYLKNTCPLCNTGREIINIKTNPNTEDNILLNIEANEYKSLDYPSPNDSQPVYIDSPYQRTPSEHSDEILISHEIIRLPIQKDCPCCTIS